MPLGWLGFHTDYFVSRHNSLPRRRGRGCPWPKGVLPLGKSLLPQCHVRILPRSRAQGSFPRTGRHVYGRSPSPQVRRLEAKSHLRRGAQPRCGRQAPRQRDRRGEASSLNNATCSPLYAYTPYTCTCAMRYCPKGRKEKGGVHIGTFLLVESLISMRNFRF